MIEITDYQKIIEDIKADTSIQNKEEAIGFVDRNFKELRLLWKIKRPDLSLIDFIKIEYGVWRNLKPYK